MKFKDVLEWAVQEYPYMDGNGELDMMQKDQNLFWPTATKLKPKKKKSKKKKKTDNSPGVL